MNSNLFVNKISRVNYTQIKRFYSLKSLTNSHFSVESQSLNNAVNPSTSHNSINNIARNKTSSTNNAVKHQRESLNTKLKRFNSINHNTTTRNNSTTPISIMAIDSNPQDDTTFNPFAAVFNNKQ